MNESPLSTRERDLLVILRNAHRKLDLMGVPYAPPRPIEHDEIPH